MRRWLYIPAEGDAPEISFQVGPAMTDDTPSAFKVNCPYCGKLHTFKGDDWEDFLIDDSTNHDYTCRQCGKMMEIVVYAEYTHEAVKPEEDDE